VKRVLLFLALAFVAAMALAVHANRETSQSWSGDAVPESRAVKTDFTVTVRSVGELRAARSTTISSTLRGDRGKIVFLIPNGSRVREGDVLVKIDPTPFAEKVDKLKAQLQELDALLEVREQSLEWEKVQAEREIETASFQEKIAAMEETRLVRGEGPLELARFEAEVSRAKSEFEDVVAYAGDLKSLEERGYANEVEIQMARQRVEEKAAQHEALLRQLESYREYVLPVMKKKARLAIERAGLEKGQVGKAAVFTIAKAIADRRSTERKVENTEVLLSVAERELEATVIRAPIPGMAVLQEEFREGEKRKPRVGDTVWPNQALLTLPDLSVMDVVTRVREVDLHKVALGMKSSIELEAFPGTVLSGAVESIGVLAQKEGGVNDGEKYFQVVVAVSGSDERLRPGMTAVVTIHSQTVEDAVAVPVQAVFGELGDYFCYVADGTGYRKRTVKIGAFNERLARVVDGVGQGERVSLVRPPERLITGVSRP
jgi:HlyD family secretion protein